ncbi:unnamed protein product [Sympodiomycopsis kandeliae]
MPEFGLFNKYQLLMAQLQAIRSAATIQAGRATVEGWKKKISLHVGSDVWEHILYKLNFGTGNAKSRSNYSLTDRLGELVNWAATLDVESYSGSRNRTVH